MPHSYCDNVPFFLFLFISAEDGKELVSPCLSPGFTGEWQHAEITYRISGQKAGMVEFLFISGL